MISISVAISSSSDITLLSLPASTDLTEGQRAARMQRWAGILQPSPSAILASARSSDSRGAEDGLELRSCQRVDWKGVARGQGKGPWPCHGGGVDAAVAVGIGKAHVELDEVEVERVRQDRIWKICIVCSYVNNIGWYIYINIKINL